LELSGQTVRDYREHIEKAIEIPKLRGASHQKKIVVMQILSDSGMVIYPEHEIFGGLEERTQTA